MYCCRTVHSLIQKSKIDWKLVINRGLSASNSVLPKVSHCNLINKSNLIQSNIQLGKNSNVITTVARRQSGTANQDKEKMKNYIFLGVIFVFVSTVFLYYQSMQRENFDIVYLETPEDKK